jgi:hypothetical protein
MKNNAKKAKSAASVSITAAQQQSSIDNSGMCYFIFFSNRFFFIDRYILISF